MAAALIGVAVLVVFLRGASPVDDPSVEPVTIDGNAPTAPVGGSYLYGRVLAADGTVYEGRLRFGGNEEAFWDDAFNGARQENVWTQYAPPEALTERKTVSLFGITVSDRQRPIDTDRPFMIRFGDLARIETPDHELRVVLKNGNEVPLDRFGADDFADGLRIWDAEKGIIDLSERDLRRIEFLPTPVLDDVAPRLFGTVQTTQGSFRGPIIWNREARLLSDAIQGRSDGTPTRIRFDAIASLKQLDDDTTEVTLLDGSQLQLRGPDLRGVTVLDARFGRVLVDAMAFQSLTLASEEPGQGYDDFPPSVPLQATVTTRSGDRFDGRLVFDLDEQESVETLDASREGVQYALRFESIATIEVLDEAYIRVELLTGDSLELERSGDLGYSNLGLLIFGDDDTSPQYVAWREMQRIELR